MDYSLWTTRAREFLQNMRDLPGDPEVTIEIAPPLTLEGLESIRKNWHRHLPAELVRFWTEGSSRLYGQYCWEPPDEELGLLQEIFEYDDYLWGGPAFLAAWEVNPEPMDTSEFAGDIMFGTPDQQRRTVELWGRSIIIFNLVNGDCLGLDPEAPGCDKDDPPVVYLIHDDASSGQLCPRFTTFLSVWEDLCYIGPERGKFDGWHCPQDGLLNADGARARKLRALLARSLSA